MINHFVTAPFMWGKWGRALAARGEIELAPLVIPER